MSDVIDSLLINIEAQAKNVDDRLEYISIALGEMADTVNRIDTSKMTALANGLSQITQSVKGLASTSNKSFTSFSDKISQLGSINTEGLNRVAETFGTMGSSLVGLSEFKDTFTNVSNLANSIAKLGGVKVTQAITNIPLLTDALERMMRVLASMPQVSENTIRMTEALANLASQGQKVSSATKAIQGNMKNLASQAEKSRKSFSKFIESFNNMLTALNYVKAIINSFKRTISKIWENVDLSMDYVEIYNYWNVVTDKITQEAKAKGNEAGGEYVEGFTEQLKTLTQKMSGYALGKAGELIQTGEIGLGMDASAIMQYQARIMGITNAVGLLERTSIKTSKALSMLAGDLSSLTNQDVSTVMQNLQSGLIGQSRALYKYGIDITNNTLAQYAFANGINKSVTEMTQSEKMYLRMIAILDQSKVAWGDQANTINSVANQYRIMKQQLANLARTIGNLFLPIIQKVLPYINGFIIALQRLLSLLGFKIYGGNWLADLQDGISGGASALDGMDEDAEGLGDALDDAGKSAKKLKSNLLGIDELNVLNQEEDSGADKFKGYDVSAGLADALDLAIDEYESVWDEAFKKMANRAEEIANKILAWFDKIANSKFWQNMKDLWKILKQIAGIVFDNLKLFWDNFLKPVASWLGNEVLAKLVDTLQKFMKKVNWDKLNEALGNFYKVLAKFVKGIGGGLIDFFKAIADFALSALAKTINVFAKALNGLSKILLKIPDSFLHALGGALGGLLITMIGFRVAPKILDAVETALINLMYAWDKLKIAFTSYLPLTILVMALGVLIAEIQKVKDEMDALASVSVAEAISKQGTTIEELADRLKERFDDIGTYLDGMSEKFNSLSNTKASIDETLASVSTLVEGVKMGAYTIDESIAQIIASFNQLVLDSQSAFNQEYDIIMQGVAGAIGDAYAEFHGSVDGIVTDMFVLRNQGNEAIAGIKKDIQDLENLYNKGKLAPSEYSTQIMDLYKKLASLNGQGIVEASKKEFEGLAESLDLSKYVKNGQFDTTAFSNYFESVKQTYQDGISAIDEETNNYLETLDSFRDRLDSLGVEYDKIEFSKLYSAASTSAREAKAEYDVAWQEFLDAIQYGVAEQMPNVVQNALDSYEALDYNEFQKMVVPKEDFVEGAVNKWRDEIVTPIFEEIGVQVEGESEEAQSWGNDLIDEMRIGMHNGIGDMDFENMFANMQTSLESASVNMKQSAHDTGYYIYQGLEDGVMEKALADGATVGATLGDNVLKDFNNSMGIHSPSTEMIKRGDYIVQGLNKGISIKIPTIKIVIDELVAFMKKTFNDKRPEFINIGFNVGMGIAQGLRDAMPHIIGVVNEIASALQEAFQSAMQIHSPSRVMYRLGQYTVEGLKLGMESLYDVTTRSFERFSDAIIATPKQIDYNVANSVANGNIKFANAQVSNEQTESALFNILVPYLSQIAINTRETADKDNSVYIGDREIARANNRGQSLLGAKLVTG